MTLTLLALCPSSSAHDWAIWNLIRQTQYIILNYHNENFERYCTESIQNASILRNQQKSKTQGFHLETKDATSVTNNHAKPQSIPWRKLKLTLMFISFASMVSCINVIFISHILSQTLLSFAVLRSNSLEAWGKWSKHKLKIPHRKLIILDPVSFITMNLKSWNTSTYLDAILQEVTSNINRAIV